MHDSELVRARIMGALAGLLLVLLVACGKTAGPTVAEPGDFSITALSAFCIDASTAGVRVEWSGAEHAAEYLVLRDGGELVTLGSAVRSYSDTDGLAPGAAPVYVLRARNAGGTTETAEVTFTVTADLCDTELPVLPTPPAPVTGFGAAFECTPQTGVRLTWPAVSGAASYLLERNHVIIT